MVSYYCTVADGYEVHDASVNSIEELYRILRATSSEPWERLVSQKLEDIERDRYYHLMGEEAYREFYHG